MGNIDFWFLLVLLGLFFLVNFLYRKFPRNQEKLFKMLTKDQL